MAHKKAFAAFLSGNSPQIAKLDLRHGHCSANDVLGKWVSRGIKVLLAALLPMVVFGCAENQAAVASEHIEWVAASNRAATAFDRVRPAFSGSVALRLQVFQSPRPAAYCWSSGTIYLSNALIQSLTDDEVAAAIAHEMGHLVPRGFGNPGERFALEGVVMDEEQRADAIAVNILKKFGIAPTALVRVLEKMRDAPQTPIDLCPALQRRIALLAGE
jgi:Zn-dependent protease with chaperone function